MFCNKVEVTEVEQLTSRNPCFSGQCFAMDIDYISESYHKRRNPCFSGQCFAIKKEGGIRKIRKRSQSLF